MNSRPITYQSANPEENVQLTPNHFLCGQIGGQFAPESVDETTFNPRKRWRRVQELVRHFWHRWTREWLPPLNFRKKWLRTERDLKVGDIVLVISPNTPRGHWPLGRITEIFPGEDGHVESQKCKWEEMSLSDQFQSCAIWNYLKMFKDIENCGFQYFRDFVTRFKIS